ncbi:hypothetical protein Bca52824_083248 [Brassica carinata]|uniref:FBD domain-containing protein n=1 Tax=Brassica carinata TaxID=52824 RepID=A0A8X7TSX0_BRACI|nr:hypothetical protein Bca52824_083248 [Brassica carinata]
MEKRFGKEKQVPVFDLDSVQFDNDVSSFMEFVDRFLESDKKLALDRFKLMCSYEDLDDDSVLKSWIDALVRRRVRHLDFQVNSDDNELVCIAPYASVNIDVNFEGKDGYALDLDDDDDDSNSKRTMIRNILTRIFTVSRMEISSVTLQVINDYSKLEMLPQFSNLSWLYASFLESFWELLPTFLGCCPNLHTLILGFEFDKEECPIKLSSVPPCFVSSLKYVELATQGTTRPSSQMKLAIYFLRNCAALKKLTLSGSFGYDIIKKIKKIPRRSRRCIIVTG